MTITHILFLHSPTAQFPSFVGPLVRSPPLVLHHYGQMLRLRDCRTIALAHTAQDERPFNGAEFMQYTDDVDAEGKEQNLDDIEGSPWDGAIIYKRSPSGTHLEYCTTLERLGMAHLSTPLSRSKASDMGLRVTRDVKDFLQGTPVQVSLTVTRKKNKWRLDGIIRTVLTVSCVICDGGAAKAVFSDVGMLLCDEPVVEPEVIEVRNPDAVVSREKDEDIDWDDMVHFPPGQREVDITKPIRDLIFLEDSLDAVCLDPKCSLLAANDDSFHHFYHP